MSASRRVFLAGSGALIATAGQPWASRAGAAESFAAIEAKLGGRLGIAARDTATGHALAYRADERFPMCSTFKLLLAAAILARVDAGQDRLDRRIAYGPADLLEYAPFARAHVAEGGATVGGLAEAAVALSDNTAANLLLAQIGGPEALTRTVRGWGDPVTRLDRIEPALNEVEPGDPRDTTTPQAMAADLDRLLLGTVLSTGSRAVLEAWLAATRTGEARLKAGLPARWTIGHKTGTWNARSINDVAILRPPGRAPILVAAFVADATVPTAQGEAALAAVAREVALRL